MEAQPETRGEWVVALNDWVTEVTGCLEGQGFRHPMGPPRRFQRLRVLGRRRTAMDKCWRSGQGDEVIGLMELGQRKGWIDSGWRDHLTGPVQPDDVWNGIDWVWNEIVAPARHGR
jgi:hypothetical protein